MKRNKWLAGMLAMMLACQPVGSMAGEDETEIEESVFMQNEIEKNILGRGNTALLNNGTVDGDSETDAVEYNGEEAVITLDTNEVTTTEIVNVTEGTEVAEPPVETIPDITSEIETNIENAIVGSVETDETEAVALTQEVSITESTDKIQTEETASETSSDIFLGEKADSETEEVEVPVTEETTVSDVIDSDELNTETETMETIEESLIQAEESTTEENTTEEATVEEITETSEEEDLLIVQAEVSMADLDIAETDFVYIVDSAGVITIIRYIGTKKDVVIPNELEGHPVVNIGTNAFNDCSTLTGITIPNSVTSIGAWAFSSCSSLTDITIPNSVTSIGGGAFYGCNSLTSIVIPKGVTNIEEWAFSGCSSLTDITIPNSVMSIGGGAFSGCNSLTSVVIPKSVTNIEGGAFFPCDSLTSITIPVGSYDFSHLSSLTSVTFLDGVTSIKESAFSHCWNLSSITIPNSVTSIGESAFYGCILSDVYYNGDIKSWKKVIIGNGNENLDYATVHCLDGDYIVTDANFKYTVASSGYATITKYTGTRKDVVIPRLLDGYPVKKIGDWAFESCNNVTSITIPDSVTAIGKHAFYGCGSLTSINIPNSVTSIDNWAFSSCKSITNITIPDSVTSIGEAVFCDCISLTDIDVSSGNPIYEGKSGILFDKKASELIAYPCGRSAAEYTVPDGTKSITREAFIGCTNLNSINIPNSVTSIGIKAFAGCSGLTRITLSNSLTSIEHYVFNGCSSLTSITIPDGVKSIGASSFEGCSSLTSITIPNGVTSIGDHAFNGCSSLTKIIIPSSVKSIGANFHGCSSLMSIEVSSRNPVYEFKEGMLFEKTSGTLVKCLPKRGTTEYIVPNGTKAIANNAYSDCSNLTSIIIPSSVTSVGSFSGCSKLTSIIIANGQTSIFAGSFENCTSLTSITIPDSVTAIGGYAFEGCSNLSNVYYGGSKDSWNKVHMFIGNKCLKSATIHYNCNTETCKHKFSSWKTETKATALKAGKKTRTCSICNKEESKTIVKLKASVTLNVKVLPLNVGQSTSKVEISKKTYGDAVKSWTSSDQKTATVTKTGKITGKKVGKAVITLTMKSGAKANVTVNVQKKSVATTKLTVTAKNATIKNKKLTMEKGKSVTLVTTLTPFTSTDKVTFKSSKKTVVTVTAKGKLTAKRKGKATITVTAGKKSYKLTVTVE